MVLGGKEKAEQEMSIQIKEACKTEMIVVIF
jgi:hypothetical protein